MYLAIPSFTHWSMSKCCSVDKFSTKDVLRFIQGFFWVDLAKVKRQYHIHRYVQILTLEGAQVLEHHAAFAQFI